MEFYDYEYIEVGPQNTKTIKPVKLLLYYVNEDFAGQSVSFTHLS